MSISPVSRSAAELPQATASLQRRAEAASAKPNIRLAADRGRPVPSRGNGYSDRSALAGTEHHLLAFGVADDAGGVRAVAAHVNSNLRA
jgi:hypothetical protein